MNSKIANGLKQIYMTIIELIVMSKHPAIFYFVWNYGIAFSEKSNIPKLDILQVISIIVLFHILISYVLVYLIKPSNNEDTEG